MTFQSDRITSIPAPLPLDYDRQYSFTDWETNNPGVPYEASGLEAEFNAIQQALDETQARARLIQDDDGSLLNESVGNDQLKSEVLIGANAPTNWASVTSYAVSDTVFYNNSWYYCLEAHVSSPSGFATDLAAGKWRLLLDLTTVITLEAQNWANYPEDSLVPEGDLVDDYSALHHAAKAAASATTAAAAAAATPSPSGGSDGDLVEVNSGTFQLITPTDAAAASTIAKRDASGRLEVADPDAGQDAVSLNYLNNHLGFQTYRIKSAVSAYKALDVGAVDADAPYGIYFSPDGTQVYAAAPSSKVHQWTLSTGWDLDTASYIGFADISAEDSLASGVELSADGTKLYVLGRTNDKVFQYSLSPAWDVTSASYDSISLDVGATLTAGGHDMRFKPDGTILYVTGNVTGPTETVAEYALSTAWDLTTASLTSTEDVSAGVDFIGGIDFSSDGRIMFIVSRNNNTVTHFHLGTPWDSSLSVYWAIEDCPISRPGGGTFTQGLFFNPNGRQFYVASGNVRHVYPAPAYDHGVVEFHCSVAYQV